MPESKARRSPTKKAKSAGATQVKRSPTKKAKGTAATQTGRSPAKKAKRPQKAQASAGKRRTASSAPDARRAVRRTTDLSEDVLKSLDEGARSAIESVRRFAETVDKALPRYGAGASRREEITDSALEMAQRLVHTQYEFLRKVIDSAGKSVTGPGDDK